jgi:hypothetical protein
MGMKNRISVIQNGLLLNHDLAKRRFQIPRGNLKNPAEISMETIKAPLKHPWRPICPFFNQQKGQRRAGY